VCYEARAARGYFGLNAMNKSVLENHDFILGVEEAWDSYYEVMVRFVEEVTIRANIHYLFVDEETKKHYYLKPRHKGHRIESVFVEHIYVNLFTVDSEAYQADKKQTISSAIGVLKLPNN
jgi:hypothetical protein